ncbi:hypothetical protein Aconfl_23190 [Algoriphagus confluentis]|uniref:Uncharacterized protein n=1 Tax=Algoriphagus confluentis TaxID=1697556 RepID=A0ABQ6PNX5_9BACT|nr:hypothetical protein Aconfl_23190 [Algoriphagus confluentis]
MGIFLNNISLTFIPISSISMIIQTLNANFLIETSPDCDGCLSVYSKDPIELQRLFGSSVQHSIDQEDWPFMIKTCKQNFAHTLILLVKEIDYSRFYKEGVNLPQLP